MTNHTDKGNPYKSTSSLKPKLTSSKEKKERLKKTESQKMADLLKLMNKKYKVKEMDEYRRKTFGSKPSSGGFKKEGLKDIKEVNASTTVTPKLNQIKEEDTQSDIKDYLNTHKMLCEMEKIEKDMNDSKVSPYLVNVNHSHLDINNAMKDESYLDTGVDAEHHHYRTEANNTTTDFSILESVKKDLEMTLGQDVLNKACEIVDSSIPVDSLTYNHETISKALIRGLMGSFDSSLVLVSIDKIPELYSLVIKERELCLLRNI